MALTDTARTMLSCNPPSSLAAALPVGLSYQPHTHVPSSDNNAAGTYKKEMHHVLKALPSRHMSSQQDIHRHSHTCNYVRPAYQPRMTAPSPASTHSRSTPVIACTCLGRALNPSVTRPSRSSRAPCGSSGNVHHCLCRIQRFFWTLFA